MSPTETDHAAAARDAIARAEIDKALDQARKENKRVAVVFGASWCPDSRAFDEALTHPLVAPIVDPAFVVVPLDVGNRDRHLGLMETYGLHPSRGIPSLAVLEPAKKEGDEPTLTGALADGELRTARSLSPVEIATLMHRLAG